MAIARNGSDAKAVLSPTGLAWTALSIVVSMDNLTDRNDWGGILTVNGSGGVATFLGVNSTGHEIRIHDNYDATRSALIATVEPGDRVACALVTYDNAGTPTTRGYVLKNGILNHADLAIGYPAETLTSIVIGSNNFDAIDGRFSRCGIWSGSLSRAQILRQLQAKHRVFPASNLMWTNWPAGSATSEISNAGWAETWALTSMSGSTSDQRKGSGLGAPA